MTNPPKTWWAPFWCGLVVDEDGKHVRRLRMAVWLLLYLIVHANRRTGAVRSYRTTIARRMKLPLRTVQRWLWCLEREGYVTLSMGAEGPIIRVLRWKPLDRGATYGASGANSGAIGVRSGARVGRSTRRIVSTGAKESRSARPRTKRYLQNGYY